jgi:hypothetical protein
MPVANAAAALPTSDRKVSRQQSAAQETVAEQEPLSDETGSEGDEDEAMDESDEEQTSTVTSGAIPPLRLNAEGLAPPTATSACSYSEYMIQRIARRNQNADQFHEGLTHTERTRMDTAHVERAPTISLTKLAEPIVCSVDAIKKCRYSVGSTFLVLNDTHQKRKSALSKNIRLQALSKKHRAEAQANAKYLSRQGPKSLPTREDISLRIDTANQLFGQNTSLQVRFTIFMWLASSKVGKTKSLAFRHMVLEMLYNKTRFPTVESVTDCFTLVVVNDKTVAFYETSDFSKTLTPYSELNAMHQRAVYDLLDKATNVYRNQDIASIDSSPTASLHYITTQLKTAQDKNCILYGTHRWFLDGLIDAATILGPKSFTLGEWVSGMAMDVDEDSYRLIIDTRLSGEELIADVPYHQTMMGSLLNRYHSRNGSGSKNITASKTELNRKAVKSLFPSLKAAYQQTKSFDSGDILPQKLNPNTEYEVFMSIGMHSNALVTTVRNGYIVIMFGEVIYDVIADDKGNCLLDKPWLERLKLCDNGPVNGVWVSVKKVRGDKLNELRQADFSYTNRAVEASLMYESGPKQFTRFSTMLKKSPATTDQAEIKSEPEN